MKKRIAVNEHCLQSNLIWLPQYRTNEEQDLDEAADNWRDIPKT
jgi:hypothetical protein